MDEMKASLSMDKIFEEANFFIFLNDTCKWKITGLADLRVKQVDWLYKNIGNIKAQYSAWIPPTAHPEDDLPF